jgi:hypothetical protein
MPSRRQIAEHVDFLRALHGGREFAEAVRGYAEDLDAGEREVLAEVLMERAQEEGAFGRAVALRVEARGWLRRQWDRLDRPTGRP